MIRRGDRKYREFECSECEIKRHIYEIERENLYYYYYYYYSTVEWTCIMHKMFIVLS